LATNASFIKLDLAILGPDQRVEKTITIKVSQDWSCGQGASGKACGKIGGTRSLDEFVGSGFLERKEFTNGVRDDDLEQTITVNVTKGWL
jgi:hypothetical protein